MIRQATISLVALLLSAPACDNKTAGSAPIPEALRGAYGRTEVDAFLPTLGLEVDVDTLRYSELTVKIVAGKELANGSYQIDEAELRWAKDAGTDDPKKCKGTIDRHGTRLLLTMFKMDSDSKCEASLLGDWEAWSLVDTVPETMAGSYGRKDPYAVAEGVRLEGKQIIQTRNDEVLELEEAVMFESKANELIVRKGVFGETLCTGSVTLSEEGLVRGKLDPVEGTGPFCPSVFGNRWSINTAQIPKGQFSNGKVSVEVRGETVLLKTLDEQNLKCEQAILRTANRNVADSGRDGIPVMGGQVLVLHSAKPTSGASACADRLGGLAQAQCEEYLGVPCDASTLSATAHSADEVQCPSHIVIGDTEGGKRKVALLPKSLENSVCWELREPLAPAK
ncbi:MAG: hypothetical protein ACRBN8_26460 [Nannocystales bacterium]